MIPEATAVPTDVGEAESAVCTGYVQLLDWLDSGMQSIQRAFQFIVHRCPELIAYAPMRPGSYVRGLTEIQEYAAKRWPADWDKIRKKIHADPELVKSVQSWEFFSSRM